MLYPLGGQGKHRRGRAAEGRRDFRRAGPVFGGLAAVALVAALAAWAVWGERGSSAQAPPGSPNVVVVMTDDQTVREMRALRETRRLFARGGVEFVNSIASFPLCCPSRATFLTGQYAHNHGVLSNKESEGGGYRGFDDDRALPVTLANAGYVTGFVGKYLNNYQADEVPQGWAYWAGKKGGVFDYKLNVNGEVREFGSRPRDYQTDVTARLARRFVERNARRERPFFLWLSFHAPHGEKHSKGRERNPRPAPRHADAYRDRELPRPPSFDERDVSDKPRAVRETKRLKPHRVRSLERRERSRHASLLAVDEAVAALARTLRRAGVAERTYLIFTSDNGFMLGEHRQARKTLLYEESLEVPLLMLGPGIPQGEVRRQPVANIDLAPTIYEATGVRPGRRPDGISLLPLARDPDRGRDREILIENGDSVGVRSAGWVYVEHGEGDGREYELYDLTRDRHQLENLVDADSGELRDPDERAARVLERLRARLGELRGCAGSGCR